MSATATAGIKTGALREGIHVFKPRIALAIMVSALGGIALAPQAAPDAWRIAVLAGGVFLAAGAAGAFNQWAERDLDALMSRTARRPFVTGRFQADFVWLAAICALLALSVLAVAWATNAWAALYTFLGAFTYGVVYTLWLKRRTWTNIIVGGLAGSFAVLAGAAAVSPQIGPAAWILTVVLFLWTPPHFWSLAIMGSADYRRAGVPMLPVIYGDRVTALVILAHAAALSVLSLLPYWYGMGLIYLAGAALGGALFTLTSVALALAPSRKTALRNFLASLVQLTVLVGAAIADRLIGGLV